MTTNQVDWTPEIENYIQGARRALKTAQLDLEDEDYTGSINRSYYAAFYAANALLATLGLQRSKHSAARAVLHQHFIKPGLIEAENGELYDGLFDQRMMSDYEILLVKERESAQSALDAARVFVVRVERFLASSSAQRPVRELREAYALSSREDLSPARPRDLSGLQPNERAAVQSFIDRLHAQLGERIERTVLFGSKARGDSGSDSDIDILVVVDAVDRRFETQVSGIASEVDLEYDVLLNTHPVTRERWQDFTRRRAAFWLNVQRDGIELRPEPARVV
jgi:uncharacterized protein (UPF0332 family)/predicted nucleotidyltransferase